MVKDHSVSKRGNLLLLPLHGLLFPISSQGSFYMHHLTDRSIGWNERERERNVLFNDALSTFLSTVIWRQTYG